MIKKSKNSHPLHTPRISTAKTVFRNNGYNDGNITFDQWYDLTQQNCFYCNSTPAQKANRHLNDKNSSAYARKYGTFIYNGVDRINNLEKHNTDNCVPCCMRCNMAKGTMSIKQFKVWVIKTYNHFIAKNKKR